jgi:integrase
MATVSTDTNGNRRIQFSGLDRKRRTLYAGKISARAADDLKRLVESILESAACGLETSPTTAKRLDGLGDDVHAKLVAVGLVNPREKAKAVRVSVAEHAEAYLALRTDIKPGSRLVLGQVVRNLCQYFGTTALADVRPADADDFSRWLATDARVRGESSGKPKGLSPATLGKRISWSATIWRDAVRRGLVDRNPFDEVRRPCTVNQERRQYVPRETIETLIAAEPDPEWRALLALARYLGLRTPSEPFSMVWSDIDWERRRIKIRSPKTEGHGKSFRVAPLLPEILPHLEALFAVAPEGLYVFERLRERDSRRKAEKGFWAACNLRTFLLKKLEKAGIVAWPKLWHNLRASAQTDLTARFPAHSVAQWMGNTVQVANKHYLMVTDADFDRAASEATQIPTQCVVECVGIEGEPTPGNEKTPGNPRVSFKIMTPAGFEPALQE